MVEEIIKLKAEIFDIIRQQELYVINTNNLQQKRSQKMQELKDIEQKGILDDIIKMKAQIFDIINQQDAYIAASNDLQQLKLQKLQTLNNIESQTPQVVQTPIQATPNTEQK